MAADTAPSDALASLCARGQKERARLYLGDADINFQTVVRAGRRLSIYWPRSRSTSS